MPMLEHPEIGWIERTGYPSWMQEDNEPTVDLDELGDYYDDEEE